MNRIAKSVGFSLCGLLLAPFTWSWPTLLHAQTISPTETTTLNEDEQPVSAGALKITVISGSTIAGVSALVLAGSQSAIAQARSSVHSQKIYSGAGGKLIPSERPNGTPSIGEVVLRGTSPGDVVRLEYIVGSEAAMEQAVLDLKAASEFWTNRAAELSLRHADLVERANEARRVFSELPLNEQSRGLRYNALNELNASEAELKSVKLIFADADKRMHAARGQYAAETKNLEVSHQFHRVNQSYHIAQDVYVDGSANQMDTVLGRAIGETTVAARANQAIPHIRITRIQVPNAAIVQRSIRNMKAGLWAAGISVGLILEEITVGEISKGLAEKARLHYWPETRIEPAAASASDTHHY